MAKVARGSAQIIRQSGIAELPICRAVDERVGPRPRHAAIGAGCDFPILVRDLIFAFFPQGGPRFRIHLPPARRLLRTSLSRRIPSKNRRLESSPLDATAVG